MQACMSDGADGGKTALQINLHINHQSKQKNHWLKQTYNQDALGFLTAASLQNQQFNHNKIKKKNSNYSSIN